MSNKKLGIVMDDIKLIKPYKDSSLAMLLEAQSRGWEIYYMQIDDLFQHDSISFAHYHPLTVSDDNIWYQLKDRSTVQLDQLDIILMRKDPPFNLEYIYATYLLEQAEDNGCLIVNKASSLRDCNEKLYTREFPQCCPPNLITRKAELIHDFMKQHKDIILKPLDGMGGESIFRIKLGDPNTNVIIESVTRNGNRQTMAQRFLPEISDGDKRILLINGEPIDYALARIPKPGENRGNIAAGGSTRGQPLSARDRWICQQIGPDLRARGLIFVGIDVIGDYLTEINVTSPTCIRELDAQFDINISATLFDHLENRPDIAIN